MRLLRRLTQDLLRIQPEELKPVFFLGLVFFAMLAGLEMTGSVAEILFFRRVGVDELPKLYSLEPFIMVTLLAFYGSVLDRIGRYRLLYALNGVLIAGILLARVLIGEGWQSVYPVLWLAQRIFYGLAPLTFWVLCSDVFDVRQGKRLFAVLLGGGLFGATIGNLLIGLLALVIAPENILLVAAGLFGLSIFALARVRRLRLPTRHVHATAPVEKNFSLGLPRHLLREPFLQALFLLMWIIGALEPILRYELNALADQTFAAEKHLVTFYGLLKAGAAIFIVIFQLAFAGRLTERLGVPRTLSILPIGYLILLPLLGLFTNVYLGAGVVALLVTFAASFHGPARNSALNLFPAAERGRISAFSDQLWYVGWLCGSVFLIWAEKNLTLSGINLATVLASGLWLAVLPSLRQRYARTCLQSATLPIDSVRLERPARPADPLALTRFSEALSRLTSDDHLAHAVEGFKWRDAELDGFLRAALAGEAARPHLFRALRSPSRAVREGALAVLRDHRLTRAQIVQAIGEQVRYAFATLTLIAPLEQPGNVWSKLTRETEHASAQAALLLLELIYPVEQIRPLARLVRSPDRSTRSTGFEALDNLITIEGEAHLHMLLGDAPMDEKRRYAARRLGVPPARGTDESLWALIENAGESISFWARVEARRRQALSPSSPDEDTLLELAQKIDALRATPLLAALTEDELKMVAQCAREWACEAGQVVCEEGQPANALYVLLAGQMELTNAKQCVLQPPAMFGEFAMLAGEAYPFTAVAVTPARLIMLDRETWRELMGYYPHLAEVIMRTLAARLQRQAH